MFLEIATLKINIINKSTSNCLDTPYLHCINNMFGLTEGTADYDFTLKITAPEKINIPIVKPNRRYQIQYIEENNKLFFNSQFSASYIDLKNRTMLVSFKDISYNGDTPDRLLIAHLRHLISLLVVNRGGIPFHSAALTRQGKGIVFSGSSGSGKTTAANLLSSDWQLLNDEYNVLMPQKGSYYVCSTPFTNHDKLLHCTNCYSRIDNIFSIEKGNNFKIGEMKYKEKYLFLLCGLYTLPTTGEHGNRIFENVSAICNSVKINKLYFNKDSSLINNINSYLQGANV